MTVRRRLAILGLAFLTGAAIGQTVAPDAHADESTFITALDGDGLPVTAVSLGLGHLVCEDIITNGVAGVDNQIRIGLSTGMSTHDVAHFVGDAVNELCPSGIPAIRAWAANR